MEKKNLLLLSTSTVYGKPYLSYALPWIKDHFKSASRIVFFPYARPSGLSHDAYTEKAAEFFNELGIEVTGAHLLEKQTSELNKYDGIFIGGGNTFVLLSALWHHGWVSTIRKAVSKGIPYMGTSAGTNVATVDIRTTNDMPVVYPPTFEALGLVNFNINPHYLDPVENSTHMGETRETRINEFHIYNENPVLGLREGSALRVNGNQIELLGDPTARLFIKNSPPVEIEPGVRIEKSHPLE
jgi:dipeptidase E